MKKEEQLYHLIQNLSVAEKKDIRLNINKFRTAETNKNLLLFDTLNKQKKYLENQTEKSYKLEGYTSKYLAADRNLLYDLVLDNLTNFHQKKTAEIKLSKGYQYSVLLYEKKLFAQALKQIEKVEKEATKFEFFGIVLNLLHLKQKLYKQLNQLDNAIKAIDDQQKYWKAQQELNEYIKLHYQSVKFRIALGKARSKEELVAFEQFMENPLLSEVCQSDLFQANFHYLEIYCNYYFVKNDKKKELEYNQALGKLIKKHDWFDKNEPLVYLAIQTRIFAIKRTLFPNDFFSNIESYRLLIKGFTKQKVQAAATIFIFSYNYELDSYLKNKDWKKGYQLVEPMLQGLKKYDKQIGQEFKITAHYRIACIYFYNQKYEEALTVLDIVINNFAPTLRPEVHSFALLIKAIVHYELGNQRLLPHLIKSTEYHIKTRNLLFQTERITISFLKKLASNYGSLQEDIVFREYINNIEVAMELNPKEKLSLEIFDFITWAKAKI